MSWDDKGAVSADMSYNRNVSHLFRRGQGGVMEDSERKLFIDVVDLGSLSKAAAKHFVTPQSVSQHIRKLEGELGFPLLVRTAQGVSPTEAGCIFYEGCKDIDERLERLLSQCREEAGIMRATLRLGSSPTYSLALFSKFVPQYLRSHPNAKIEYVNVDSHPLEGLLMGDYDVLEGIEPQDRAFAFEPLLASRRCCMVSPENPLSSREVIEPADLVDMDVYIFNKRWAARLREYLDKVCPEVKLIELPGSAFESVVHQLNPTRTVHLLPEQLTGRYQELIPIPFDADVTTQYGLVYLPKSQARLHALLECARKVYGAQNAQ